MCCYSGYRVSLHSSYTHLFGANDADNMMNTHHTWGRVSSDYTPPRCKPRKTVYMLRVPKTGSTTLLNIMYRYVKRYELKMPHLYLELIASRNYIIREDLMYPTEAPPPPFGSYNFYGEHIAFNQSDVDHVLGPGSFKLAAVRYPLTQFRSIFKEWHLGRKMKLSSTDPVREYLTSRLKSQDLVNASPFYTHSLTARHFGLTEENYLNHTAIKHVIEIADKAFDLVMVNEFYDESLILLKRRLCWEPRDILYIPNRISRYRNIPTLMPWEVEHSLQTLNPADFALFRHFARKLFDEIGKENYFWQELWRFRTMNRQVR